MEEEGHTNDQRQKERLRGKLRTGLVSVQEHYEALLKTTLRASRRAYIKGKLEIFKRIVDEIEKRKKDIEKDFRRHFLSNVYSDIPEKRLSHNLEESLVGSHNSSNSLEAIEGVEEACLGRRTWKKMTELDDEGEQVSEPPSLKKKL